MNSFEALILGFLQGLTEFLPVSSSGHLIVFPKLFGWTDQGLTFDVFLHLGTLAAVVWYFRKEWQKLTKSVIFWKDPSLIKERKLTGLILVGILPALVLGGIFEGFIATSLRLPLVVGINLIFWGLILGIADRLVKKNKNLIEQEADISPKKAFLIGLFQAVSLIPGGSRSGLSITGGLFCGLKREAAVRFSFLMATPLILGAGLFEGIKAFSLGINSIGWLPLGIGFASAFFSGFLAIRFLVFLARRADFLPFVIYRLVLGILILIFL